MVGRGPAATDWLGRILPLLVSTSLGLVSAGIVFYFSSQRAEIATLAAQVNANTTAISNLQLRMELGKANRDRQIDEIVARLDRRR